MRRSRRGLWLAILAAVVVIGVVVTWALTSSLRVAPLAGGQPTTAPSPKGRTRLAEGVGTYAAPIRTGDGHIDIARTVSRLKAVGATRYYYLIWDHFHPGELRPGQPSIAPSPAEWEQLPEFAAAAQRVGIDVIVYLVPPTETSAATYAPFGWDYDKWFAAVGRVAKQHPNIRGIAMDDFAANTMLRANPTGRVQFTPSSVRTMVAEARAGAPWLRFYAVLYAQDVVSPTGVLPEFRNVVDAVIYAYAGPRQQFHVPQNSYDPAGALATGELVRRLTRCDNSPSCIQVALRPPVLAHVALPQSVTLGKKLDLDRPAQSVSFEVLDDRSKASVGAYLLSLEVQGTQVPLVRTTSGPWSRYEAHLREPVSGSVDLRLAVSSALGSQSLALTIDRVTIGSGAQAKQLGAEGWSLAGTSGASVDVVKPLELVYLVYCAPLGIDAKVPGAAGATYVESVMAQVSELAQRQEIDGVVAYRVNLDGTRPDPRIGDPAAFDVVRRAYGRLG
jgi:hypothetical protein